MYFELSPKSKKADFYDHEYEYYELKEALERQDPLVVVLGVRRVGKLASLIFSLMGYLS